MYLLEKEVDFVTRNKQYKQTCVMEEHRLKISIMMELYFIKPLIELFNLKLCCCFVLYGFNGAILFAVSIELPSNFIFIFCRPQKPLAGGSPLY
jgi:hypothetical protein